MWVVLLVNEIFGDRCKLQSDHFHQVQDSEVREVRLPSVSCPQHLVLSLEEQVS